MASPRFNDRSQRRGIARSAMGANRAWIKMPQAGPLADSVASRRKRIFAIVSRPIPTKGEGKTIRRILLFDNHPASLRLVLESGFDLETDDAASRREMGKSIICGSILIAMVIAAVLWPLLW